MKIVLDFILDSKGNVLNQNFFNVPNEIIVENFDNETGMIVGGGIVILNKTSFEIYVPCYENAKEIVIFDDKGVELERRTISEYSKKQENASNSASYNVNNRIIINSGFNYALILFIIIVIVVIVIILFIIFKKRR